MANIKRTAKWVVGLTGGGGSFFLASAQVPMSRDKVRKTRITEDRRVMTAAPSAK